MFLALQNGWNPPEHITEEEYNNVRQNKKKYPEYYVGYVGFNATFSAKYFGGYARGFKSDGITPRDLSNEAYRNLMKQMENIKDVKFICSDYTENEYCNLKNTLIYCDPPYQHTTKFETDSFDYDKFWEWCRGMSKYNKVFISEYQAPDDFECVWSKESLANFDCNRGNDRKKKLRTEKLFTYNLKEHNTMKDSVKETLKRLGISLTKETDKGTCVKTSYELLEELAEKWETQLLKD